MHQTLHLATKDLRDSWLVQYHLADAGVKECFGARYQAPLVSLGEVSSIQSGVYAPAYSSEGTPYTRVDNVRGVVANMSRGDIVYIPRDSVYRVPPTAYVRRDDIVVARTGTLGKAMLITDNLAGSVMSQHVTSIRSYDDRRILPGFLCLYLNGPRGREQLIGKGAGSTRPELTNASLKTIKIPVLPAEMQQRYDRRLRDVLGGYYGHLSCITSLLRETDCLLGLEGTLTAPEQTKGPVCFSIDPRQMGDVWFPARYRTRQALRLKQVTARFSCRPLGEVASVARGKGTRVSQYASDGLPFMRTSSLINNSIDPFPDHYASPETALAFDQCVADGDILFSIEGRIGQVALLTSEFQAVYKNHIERVRLNKEVLADNPEGICGWVYLVLASTFGQMQCSMHSVVQATIPGLGSRLRRFMVPLPVTKGGDALSESMLECGRKAYRASLGVLRALVSLRQIQECFNSMLLEGYQGSLSPQ